MAKPFNKYVYYEKSVQNPSNEVDFFNAPCHFNKQLEIGTEKQLRIIRGRKGFKFFWIKKKECYPYSTRT